MHYAKMNEDIISESYPLGGMIEPYDIWREQRMLDTLEQKFELDDEEELEKFLLDSSDTEDDDTEKDKDLDSFDLDLLDDCSTLDSNR